MPICNLDQAFWDRLLEQIENHEVIPVVGPGAVTHSSGDRLLYPELQRRLVSALNLQQRFQNQTPDFEAIVNAERAATGKVDRIYRKLNKLLEHSDLLRPGATLSRLADIVDFDLLLTTTFDSLLARAVEACSAGGRPEERRGAISLRDKTPDLPAPVEELKYRFVYQILGRARPIRDFVVWDDDILHFLLQLDQKLPQKENLTEALRSKHLLVLGFRFDHMLLRFFVHVMKRQRLSDLAGPELYIAETLPPEQRNQVVVYLDRFSDKLGIIPGSPRAFIRLLHRKWRERNPQLPGQQPAARELRRIQQGACGTIFVSYASADEAVARFVVDQLQNAGLHTWFDLEQILPGENVAVRLGKAIQRCGLFLSLISCETATRLEGWTIFERKLAAKRARRYVADNTVYYIPVRIDDGKPRIPENEPCGTSRVKATLMPGGHLDENFIAQLRTHQETYVRRHCGGAPP